MNDVITLHKSDLAAGHKRLAELYDPAKYHNAQSPEYFDVKDRIKKYEIAFSQALNLANDRARDNIIKDDGGEYFDEDGTKKEIDVWHEYFYQRLTKPYRPEKKKETKLPAGIVNLDDEIELPQTND